MVDIAGAPYTQLTNLNVTGILRINGEIIDDGVFVKQVFISSGTIAEATDLVISTGTNTLVMPAAHVGILEIKSVSGAQTLDPGSNTIENGNTVLTTTNRRFNLEGTVWLEL